MERSLKLWPYREQPWLIVKARLSTFVWSTLETFSLNLTYNSPTWITKVLFLNSVYALLYVVTDPPTKESLAHQFSGWSISVTEYVNDGHNEKLAILNLFLRFFFNLHHCMNYQDWTIRFCNIQCKYKHAISRHRLIILLKNIGLIVIL